MTKYTMLILKNLLRSKRRTVLTVLSIGVSLFIFSVLVSLPTFANQMLADTASSVRIACRTKMGLDYPLPETYKVKIATTPHVVAVVPDVFFGGIYHEASDQFPSIAMDAENIDVMFPDWDFRAKASSNSKRSRRRAWSRRARCEGSTCTSGSESRFVALSFPST
jgi:putative ABC transport system permease protein